MLDEDTCVILEMMSYAFIEIRAGDNLELSKAYADMFHNIPNRIARGVAAEELFAEIHQKAARWDRTDYIKKLEAFVRKSSSNSA